MRDFHCTSFYTFDTGRFIQAVSYRRKQFTVTKNPLLLFAGRNRRPQHGRIRAGTFRRARAVAPGGRSSSSLQTYPTIVKHSSHGAHTIFSFSSSSLPIEAPSSVDRGFNIISFNFPQTHRIKGISQLLFSSPAAPNAQQMPLH
jgi:hypothetical protein